MNLPKFLQNQNNLKYIGIVSGLFILAALSKIIWLAVQGIIGLNVLAFGIMFSVTIWKMIPYFLQKVDNQILELRKREARENPFIITEAERNKRLAQTKSDLAFCSHSCSTAFNLERLPKAIGKTIDLEMQERIKSLRTKGLSGYKISELTGLSRITVMKYW